MIDNTHILARDYSRVIEAPGITQDQIDYEAKHVLRSMSALDMSDALYDQYQAIKYAVMLGDLQLLGKLVETTVNEYCQRVALRKLEA